MLIVFFFVWSLLWMTPNATFMATTAYSFLFYPAWHNTAKTKTNDPTTVQQCTTPTPLQDVQCPSTMCNTMAVCAML